MVPIVAPLVVGAVILAIANKLFDIMQTVSFMMFIEEEGIQIRGFGIMSLIREKLVDDAELQIAEMKVHTENLETFVDSWGWIAPYMHPTYSRYVQATYDQIDAWEAWVVAVRADPGLKCGIRVASSPTSAKIQLDGEATPFLTPHAFYDLAEGEHSITLRRNHSLHGLMKAYGKVEIETEIIKEILWELEPQQGKLRIYSAPAAAEIWLDGVNTGFLTPHTFILDPGNYDFDLEYDSTRLGLLTYSEIVSITKGYDREFRWILE